MIINVTLYYPQQSYIPAAPGGQKYEKIDLLSTRHQTIYIPGYYKNDDCP